MRYSLICCLFLSVLAPGAFGRTWHLEPSTRKLASEILDRDMTGIPLSGKIQVDRDHEADSYAVEFEVPRGIPSFLIVTTRASRPGRLTIHLGPTRLPQILQSEIPKEDWANPHRLFDFRAVVELQEGEPQEHVISLNRDFFESVTRVKRPFDLVGLRIGRVAFHLSVPVEEGQRLQVLRIRSLGLGAEAGGDYLAGLARRITDRWQGLPADSPARKFWALAVERAGRRAREFGPGRRDDRAWWILHDELEDLLLKSRSWLVDPVSRSAFLLGTASSLTRISGRHQKFGFAGPLSREVALEAARNEFETFQIVLLAPGEGVKGFRIEASDLHTGDGSRRIESENLRFFQQIEQFVQPSPGTAQSQVGWLPDALLPVEKPFSLSMGEVKPVWVSVKIPADAAAGRYRGNITVQADAGEAVSVEISLLVHDFAIPRTGRFRTQGHLALDGLTEWYRDGDSARIRREFYRLLLDHRFSPTSQYSARLSPQREDVKWALEAGANVILIGGFSGGPLDPAIIGPAYQWLVDNGYIDLAIIYIGDETDDFKAVREKAVAIRRQWPRLRIMVGGSKPREELIGYVDVWDPITFGGTTYNFDPQSVRRAVERGEEVFWYTCVGPRAPFANIYNDHPLAAIRALWWQAWKYGVTGFEYWWFNWWRPNIALSRGKEPWPVENRTAWNSRSYDWANGDGLLVYPGPRGQALASLRLSVLRDAIEDWEVLFLLERAADKATADRLDSTADMVRGARELLRVPPEITADLTHWSTDPNVYVAARHTAYRLLAGLRAAIGGTKLDAYIQDWDLKRKAFLEESFQSRVKTSSENQGRP